MSTRRPKPISQENLRAYAHRPPLERDPTRWAWRVVRHEGGRQIAVKGAGGRFTRREMTQQLLDLLKSGDWAGDAAPLAEGEIEVRTLGDLFAVWLDEQEAREARGSITAATLDNYQRVIGRMRPALGPVGVFDFDRPVLQRWLDGCGLAPRTVRVHNSLLRSAWKWGREEGLDLPPFPRRVELPPVRADQHRRAHGTPSPQEAWAILCKLPPGWDRLVGEILLGTGARIGEVAGLRWRDYRGGVLHVRQKPGPNKPEYRAIPVNSHLRRVLEAWRTAQPRPPMPGNALHGRAVSTVRTWFAEHLREAADAVGVDDITPHSFRRLVSTTLIAAGPAVVPPKEYEALMGHSYQMGLRIYAEARPERMAGAVALLVPAGAPPKRGEVRAFPTPAEEAVSLLCPTPETTPEPADVVRLRH